MEEKIDIKEAKRLAVEIKTATAPKSNTAFKVGRTIEAIADSAIDNVYREQSANGMGYLVLEKDKPFAEQVKAENTIYEIRYNFDLGGAEVTIPSNCTLKFEGGKLSNGTLKGNFRVNSNNKFISIDCFINGSIIGDFFAYNASSRELNASILSSVTGNIWLMENIYSRTINLKSNLYGDKTIDVVCDNGYKWGIYIEKDNVEIKGIGINVPTTEGVYKNAIRVNEASNITIESCSINGALYFRNRTENKKSGIIVKNCDISCDFSVCEQAVENQNDAISIYGYSDVEISFNTINHKNGTRVFKTAAGIFPEDFSFYSNASINIHIHHNYITATSDTNQGKQLYDMYIGSENVDFSYNVIKATGYRRITENKTALTSQNGERGNYINIRYNTIETDASPLMVDLPKNVSVNYDYNYILALGDICKSYGGILVFNAGNVSISNNTIKCKDDTVSFTNALFQFKQSWDASLRVSIDCIKMINNDVRVGDISDYNLINIDNADIITLDVNGIKNDLVGRIMRISNSVIDNLHYYNYEDLSYWHIRAFNGSIIKNLYTKISTNAGKLITGNPTIGNIISNQQIGRNQDGNILITPLTTNQVPNTEQLVENSNSYNTLYKKKMFYCGGDGWVDANGYTIERKFGNTSSRPTLLSKDIGYVYFDTTLGKPIYWAGTKWVDATGADV